MIDLMMKLIIFSKNAYHKCCLAFIFALLITSISNAQFAPAAGQIGSSAIYKDSSIIVNWAKSATITRGFQDISNTSLGETFIGDSSSVIGMADINNVISLGDGGSVICQFQYPIINGNGYDFAVFENSFQDDFLELAFVEVSSDGLYYSRFPAISFTDTTEQIGSFDLINPTKLNNLAGKYRGGYGVPFDLQELISDTNLNLNNITHVRVVDVVGSINNLYANYDSEQRKINDPWPTPFSSGGFDLDAIAVIHQDNSLSLNHYNSNYETSIYPNPAKNFLHLKSINYIPTSITISNIQGKILLEIISNRNYNFINISELESGIYIVKFNNELKVSTTKFIKQ